jgi:cation transport protein ChaC
MRSTPEADPDTALIEDQDTPIRLTREALHDGSLLTAARRRAPPGTPMRSDAEIEACLDAILATHPAGQDVWLFGYGSLMWNPAMHFAEHRGGLVRGWHRRYCLWLRMGRGSPESPGLMLALDRGGSAAGALFRIPASEARSELISPFRRELFSGSYDARWVRVDTDTGPVRAVTFVVNRRHPFYAGRLDAETIARHLAVATGSLGSCLEYLTRTQAALEALGKRDEYLNRLGDLVRAQRTGLPAPPAVQQCD